MKSPAWNEKTCHAFIHSSHEIVKFKLMHTLQIIRSWIVYHNHIY